MLIFDNYSDNDEFSLKHQEKINRVTNGIVRVHMRGKCPLNDPR